MLDKYGLTKNEDYIIKPKELSHYKDSGKDIFSITQFYEIKTQKINAVEQIYKSSEKFAEAGITISSRYGDGLKYYIKDPKELEKSLIIKAIMDGEEKMRQMTKTTGWRAVGLPSLYWHHYISFRAKNSADENGGYYYDKNSSPDQIATVKVSMSYNTK
jgi:hypothetical protein